MFKMGTRGVPISYCVARIRTLYFYRSLCLYLIHFMMSEQIDCTFN